MELELHDAIRADDCSRVDLLLSHPAIDPNWKNPDYFDFAAIHLAVELFRHSILFRLLSHPGIDVNLKNGAWNTAFTISCYLGNLHAFRKLLEDPRVLVNEPGYCGYTPLRWAASLGRHEAIMWWIASGRAMELGHPGNSRDDAIGEAKRAMTSVVALLEQFKLDPGRTRHHVKRELGIPGAVAAEVFAVLVFYSDGFLALKYASGISSSLRRRTREGRFFGMASRLPLELQMMLCNRVEGLGRILIPRADSEGAFGWLARTFINTEKPENPLQTSCLLGCTLQ